MEPTTYDIKFAEEQAPYDFKAALQNLLPGTCWDGSRIRGSENGWKEQLGADRLPFRDYVLTTWSYNLSEPMQVQLFKDRLATDYDSNIADAVEREIQSIVADKNN